jgi:hypothetical protein
MSPGGYGGTSILMPVRTGNASTCVVAELGPSIGSDERESSSSCQTLAPNENVFFSSPMSNL